MTPAAAAVAAAYRGHCGNPKPGRGYHVCLCVVRKLCTRKSACMLVYQVHSDIE